MSDGSEVVGEATTSRCSPYLVSEFKTREWGADGMRIGDLNGDLGGDTSYPGPVLHEGLLWVSYYSGHEGKVSIYLAQVELEE